MVALAVPAPPSPGPPPVQHRGGVDPIRLRVMDELLRVEKIITVGYRARCSCGHPFEMAHEWRDAVIALGEHKLERES